jgi:hypothetical protein
MVLPCLILWYIGLILKAYSYQDKWLKVFNFILPFCTLNEALLEALPLWVESEQKFTFIDSLEYVVPMILQAILLLCLNIYFDYRLNIAYKG